MNTNLKTTHKKRGLTNLKLGFWDKLTNLQTSDEIVYKNRVKNGSL
jgi:hypothetical protein